MDTRRGRVAVPYIDLDRVELYDLGPAGGNPGGGVTANPSAGPAGADTAGEPAAPAADSLSPGRPVGR